ncbi:NlpC/P60 family protein [Pseudonocardia nantongensis]|uniref:NlpC/P60 family protein n=1 Tax=Pseudonocardia nantongensis TaxID=1181885 RepID=UPI00397B3D76
MTTALTHPAETPDSGQAAPRRRRDRDATAGISAAELLARYSEAGFDTPAPGGRRAARTGGAHAPDRERLAPAPTGPPGDDQTMITRDVPAGTAGATGAIGLIQNSGSATGSFGRNPRAVAATMSATLVGATAVMGVVTALGEPGPQEGEQGVDLAGAATENTMRLSVPAAGSEAGGGPGTSNAATSLNQGLESVSAAVPQAFEQADAARIAAVAQEKAEKAAEERASTAEDAGEGAGDGAGDGAGEGAGDGVGEGAGASTGSSVGAQALTEAKKHLGKPYEWGATGPSSFDCSGLMQYVFEQAGKELPRNSKAQSQVDGQDVSQDELKAGDIVFFYSPVSHVGIYDGNGKILHASTSGEPVKYSDVDAMPFHNALRL